MDTYSMEQVEGRPDHRELEVAKRNLDRLDIPDGQRVAAIIAGIDGLNQISVFFKPLPSGERTPDTVWSEIADRRIEEGGETGMVPTFIGTLCVAVKERFGEDCRVYDCKCTCCADLSEIQVISTRELPAYLASLGEAVTD